MTAAEAITAVNLALSAAQQSGSSNQISSEQLREWVLEYLRDWDEEVGRFPEVASDRHWNLWMADSEPARDAVFAVVIFSVPGIEMIFGRGDSYAVREFAESDFPDDVGQLAPQLRVRFPAPGQALSVPREIAESWLGRSFPPLATGRTPSS